MIRKKDIIITGAGRGIGYATAKAVEKIADNLVLITKSRASFERIKKDFPQAKNFRGDLSNEEETVKFIREIKAQFSQVDVLINNAGFYLGKKFEDIKTKEFTDLYKIHLQTPFLLIQGLLPLLKKSTCPQVVNISSAANFARIPSESAYTVVKAGIAALGDVLREELQKYHIRFTTIFPWDVNTHKYKNPKDFLRPEDIGGAILFIINTHPNCQIMNIELSSVGQWRKDWPPWFPPSPL